MSGELSIELKDDLFLDSSSCCLVIPALISAIWITKAGVWFCFVQKTVIDEVEY